MRKKILTYLNKIQIPTRYRGFDYLVDAILYLHQNYEIVNHICSELYISIAKHHNVDARNVERCLRTLAQSIDKNASNKEFIKKIYLNFELEEI